MTPHLSSRSWPQLNPMEFLGKTTSPGGATPRRVSGEYGRLSTPQLYWHRVAYFSSILGTQRILGTHTACTLPNTHIIIRPGKLWLGTPRAVQSWYASIYILYKPASVSSRYGEVSSFCGPRIGVSPCRGAVSTLPALILLAPSTQS